MTTPILWHLCARVPLELIDGIVDLFEQFGFSGTSWLECDDARPSDHIDDSGFPIASEFIVDGYTRDKPDLDFMNNMVQGLAELVNIDAPTLTLTIVDNNDWLTACYQSMPARTVGDFYIYGTHITETPPSGLLPVIVNAATAFGSGEHATTIGCLTALSELSLAELSLAELSLAGYEAPSSILDMGCGSGILGIASKKKWTNAHVVAVDNDSESVRVTALNAQLNQTPLTVIESTGFHNPKVGEFSPYALVLANILAKPLCLLAPDFFSYMLQGGIVIMSGLLSRHKDEVVKNYCDQGFSAIREYNLDDWITLVFQKR